MNLRLMLVLVLLVNGGCIKYKKSYHPGGADGADSEFAEDSSGDDSGSDEFTDETATDEESSGEEDTALTGKLLSTIASASKSPVFEADVNLNGKHSKAKKVEIVNDEARILISDLPAIKSGQMKLEIFNDKNLQFSIRLSNVTTVASRDLKVVLNRCRPKAKSDAKEKEVICNWSAEQAMQ